MAQPGPQAPLVTKAPQASTQSASRTQPPQQPAPHVPQLNESHFKPEFSGKPEENMEAHLLRTNNWMATNRFQEDNKVQRFCLRLTGEARLWYES